MKWTNVRMGMISMHRAQTTVHRLSWCIRSQLCIHCNTEKGQTNGMKWAILFCLPAISFTCRCIEHLVGMCRGNVDAIHRIIPIECKQEANQFLHSCSISRWCWLTFRPSTTNKCRMTPNRNSLNHIQADAADSTIRDDLSDTGT